MKKQLLRINSESGFYLPIVLVVTALVLSFITSMIIVYQNDLGMTKSMMNQIEGETLIQMSREEFMIDIIDQPDANGKLEYRYPNGDVEVQYEKVNESTWMLHCTISLQNDNLPMSASFPVTLNNYPD